ncbi:MAG: hypothetical protein ACFFDC_11825, partial [Promethearchaeota archaeon]
NFSKQGITNKAYLFLSEIINITSPTSTTSAPTTTAEEAPTSSETSPSEPATTSLGCFGVLVALSLPYLFKKRKKN